MRNKKVMLVASIFVLLALFGVGACLLSVRRIDENIMNYVKKMDKNAVVERETIRLSKNHGVCIIYKVKGVGLEFSTVVWYAYPMGEIKVTM